MIWPPLCKHYSGQRKFGPPFLKSYIRHCTQVYFINFTGITGCAPTIPSEINLIRTGVGHQHTDCEMAIAPYMVLQNCVQPESEIDPVTMITFHVRNS